MHRTIEEHRLEPDAEAFTPPAGWARMRWMARLCLAVIVLVVVVAVVRWSASDADRHVEPMVPARTRAVSLGDDAAESPHRESIDASEVATGLPPLPPLPPADAIGVQRTRSGPITINGKSGAIIENLHISNPNGDCISLINATNVIIRNSTIGPCQKGIDILNGSDTVIAGNTFIDTAKGVYALDSKAVKITSNSFSNAGRNFVQFNRVSGAGNVIASNRGSNALGGSIAEDLINLYESHGTAASPIIVENNFLANGGPSGSGSGIMIGDGGGSYQTVRNNVLVNPGQVGIGVASGTNITVSNNTIYSARQGWSNVGLYVWNQYSPQQCSAIEIRSNKVDWKNSSGNTNGYWNAGNCGMFVESDNQWNARLDPVSLSA